MKLFIDKNFSAHQNRVRFFIYYVTVVELSESTQGSSNVWRGKDFPRFRISITIVLITLIEGIKEVSR